MSVAEPAAGYASKTEAVMAMTARKIAARDIAHCLGIAESTVTVLVTQMDAALMPVYLDIATQLRNAGIKHFLAITVVDENVAGFHAGLLQPIDDLVQDQAVGADPASAHRADLDARRIGAVHARRGNQIRQRAVRSFLPHHAEPLGPRGFVLFFLIE